MSESWQVCDKCGSAVSEDVRRIDTSKAFRTDMIVGALKLGMTPPQLEYFDGALRVLWARGYRGGRAAQENGT